MKRWFWDPNRRLYLDRSGDALTRREITKGIDAYIESIQEEMALQVRRFTGGDISVSTLFHLLDEEITALHGASGSIAYGGLEQMDRSKWERIDERLQTELGYLAQFRADVQQASTIITPEAELSAEGIANRAGLYAEAAYSEYVNQVVARESDEGVNLGRRICEADGASCEECVGAATEEFIPLDDIPEIGSLQCMNNCRCEIEFSVEGVQFSTSNVFQGVVGGQDAFGGSQLLQ